MSTKILPIGTRVAMGIRNSSRCVAKEESKITTLGQLLNILAENPPSWFPMLRSTASLLAKYLEKAIDEITIDLIEESKSSLRPYLESRKYAENSTRSYVNHVRILLRKARELGWKPGASLPEDWRAILPDLLNCGCVDLARRLAKIHKSPKTVTIEDVDRWVELRIEQGFSSNRIQTQRAAFWRLLKRLGLTQQYPMTLVREKDYGIPLDRFPESLQAEVTKLLKWKVAAFSPDRPKRGKHRPVTAGILQGWFSSLFGFAVNIRSESNIESISGLVTKELITDYVIWRMNERAVKGYTLRPGLGMIYAALRYSPAHSSLDLSWFPGLLNNIPLETDSERRRRKAEKYLNYDSLSEIPDNIRQHRVTLRHECAYDEAVLSMQAFLVQWLVSLPWRQRNIRECRVVGTNPNIFKSKISPFSDIDKPTWVQSEEKSDPEAQFWQFRFAREETKTGKEIYALLPKPLIRSLEEYLLTYRPTLISGADPGTLFLNQAGKPLTVHALTRLISELTLRFGGRRVTPHLFRDIVAFAWLKEHPKDYLTLSKILWHSSIETTIRIYGSRFNESSGVCAMESWLEEREKRSK